MIFSSLPQWFCRALCASTHACRWQSSVNKTALQAPVVNRLEVTTFVTLYVPATPTFTPTVTVTIGIPATSIAAVSVDPSSVTAAPAFTHGLYSFSLATAQASTGFTAVEILYAFGDWAVTPILTPVHLFLVLFVVGTVWSLVFFARFSILHQCYLEEVIRNLGHGLGTGSNILWLFILYCLNLLAADTNKKDLIEFLCVHLRNLPLHTTNYVTVVAYLQIIPQWWTENHGRQGYSPLWALWLEMSPSLVATGRILRDAFLKAWGKLPGITEKAVKAFGVLLTWFWIILNEFWIIMMKIILWLKKHVLYGFCVFLYFIVKGLCVRYCPAHIIVKLLCFYNKQDVQRYILASNMTIDQRLALVDQLVDQEFKFQQFNETDVKDLGKTAAGYKKTIDKLIKESNYFRRYIDAICNHKIEEQYGMSCWSRFPNTPGARVRTAHLEFRDTPHPETGFYFDLSLSTADKRLYPLNECMYVRYKPEYAENDRKKGLAFRSHIVRPEKMFMKELFQKDAWGMEAKFPGLKLPDYDSRADFDMQRRIELREIASPSPKKLEDIAAQGLALEVFMKRQRECR